MAEIDAASGWNTASPALQTRVPAPPRLAVPDGMAIHQKISAFHGHNSASMKRELRDDVAQLQSSCVPRDLFFSSSDDQLSGTIF
jgi:hypothetical protein